MENASKLDQKLTKIRDFELLVGVLGACGGVCGSLGEPGRHLDPDLGLLAAFLDGLGAILGPTWGICWPSWGQLGH